jgi:branched-chain amino acid transport system substrate-binding protein
MLRSDFLAGLGSVTVGQTIQSITSAVSIGVQGPFSGADRPLGEQLANGVRAAIDDANNLRTSIDKIWAMRTFDDQNRIANAVVTASFATGDSAILGVVGHINAKGTIAALPTYAGAQMPVIVPATTDDGVTATNYRNIFRLVTKDSTEGALLARYAVQQNRVKSPFVFVQDAEYGADVANGFIAAMESQKITAPYRQFSYDKPNFDEVVTTTLAGAKPDYVFLAGTVGDMGPIVPMLRSKGYTGPIGASQGFFDGATLQLGAAANDMTVSTSMPYLALAPSAQRQVRDFQGRYGPITPLALFGYAAAQIFITATKRSSASARNTLLTALTRGVPIDTIAGSFAFTPNGDPIDPELYFYSVRDGKFSYVRQAHSSSFMMK